MGAHLSKLWPCTWQTESKVGHGHSFASGHGESPFPSKSILETSFWYTIPPSFIAGPVDLLQCLMLLHRSQSRKPFPCSLFLLVLHLLWHVHFHDWCLQLHISMSGKKEIQGNNTRGGGRWHGSRKQLQCSTTKPFLTQWEFYTSRCFSVASQP